MNRKAGNEVGSAAVRAVTVALLALTTIGVIAVAAEGAQARDGFPDHAFGNHGRAVAGLPMAYSDEISVAAGPEGTVLTGAGDIVVRLGSDGDPDQSFGEGGWAAIPSFEGMRFEIEDIAVGAEGEVYAFGAVRDLDVVLRTGYMSATNPTWAAVVRLDRSGDVDHDFGENGFFVDDLGLPPVSKGYDEPITRVDQGLVRPDGSLVLVAGVGTFVSNSPRLVFATPSRVVAILTPGGELDRTFGRGDGIVVNNPKISRIPHVAVDGRGRMTIRAELDEGGRMLARLDAGGKPDPNFGHDGFLGYPRNRFTALNVDSAGRVVMANSHEVVRLTPAGRRDRSFGRGGRAGIRMPNGSGISAVLSLDSGRILLSGTQAIRSRGDRGNATRAFTVIALNNRGRPDRSFGRGGWIASAFGPRSQGWASDSALDGEGHLVLGGEVRWHASKREPAVGLVRYDLAG